MLTIRKTSAFIMAAFLSTSLSATSARADAGDFLGGVAVGVGGTLLLQHATKQSKQNRARTTTRRAAPKRSYVSSIAYVYTTREEARDLQRRLNQLGFNAGTPDGISGKRTRAAIRAFQRSIGSAVTGTLSEQDIAELMRQTTTQSTAAAPLYTNPAYAAPAQSGVAQPYPVEPLQPAPVQSARTAVTVPVSVAPSETIQSSDASIFGIMPGGDFNSSRAALAMEGFDNCTDDGALMVCEKDSAAMNDRVIVGRSGGEAGGQIYLAARMLSFKEPVRTQFISDRLTAAYPEIFAQQDLILASETCKFEIDGSREGLTNVDMKQFDYSDDLVSACASYEAVTLQGSPDGKMVDTAVITLFNSAPLQASALQQEKELEQNLKF